LRSSQPERPQGIFVVLGQHPRRPSKTGAHAGERDACRLIHAPIDVYTSI
jgi:hypothetical protein